MSGRGADSSFESHGQRGCLDQRPLGRRGLPGPAGHEAGEIAPRGTFSDTLLERSLSSAPSREVGLESGIAALAAASGELIAVAGRLSVDDAQALAATRRGNARAMVLLLAVSAWTSGGTSQDAAETAEILSAAGWRVVVAMASTPLAAAWRQLHQPFELVRHMDPTGRLRAAR